MQVHPRRSEGWVYNNYEIIFDYESLNSGMVSIYLTQFYLLRSQDRLFKGERRLYAHVWLWVLWWKWNCWCTGLYKHYVNPLNPNISMHILHTVLHTFPKVLTRRICPTFKRFFSCVSHPITFVTLMCNLAMILWGETRC